MCICIYTYMNAYYKKALFVFGISFLLFAIIHFVDKTYFRLHGYTEGLEGANKESNGPLTFLISVLSGKIKFGSSGE